MRNLLLGLMLALLAPSLLAQYPNEWIDYSKNYYKLRISKDGLYRIPYNTLSQSGLANLSGSGFKMYCKGEEVPIYVSTNGSLSNSDYIEFYGEKNDGEFDTQLFTFSSYQLTPDGSLFTDSIGYYLVWQSNGGTKRYTNVTNNISNPPTKESYFMHSELLVHKNVFWFGEPTRIAGVGYNFADFEKGEGFVSSSINAASSTSKTKTYNVNSPALYTGSGAPPAKLETKILGLDNDFFSFQDHHMRVRVDGTTYVDEIYEGYDTPTYFANVLSSDITSPRTTIVYESIGDVASKPEKDVQAISYTRLNYPRDFDFLKYSGGTLTPSKEFYFELNDNQDSYLEIKNFSGGAAPVIYDLTNNKRYIPTVQSGVYKVRLQAGTNGSTKRRLFISNTDNSVIRTIDELKQVKFTNFQSIANQGKYMIVSHSSLRVGAVDWVQSYANYRSSVQGGDFDVIIADVEELYDQFAWGIPKHPLAIRNFVNFAMNKWSSDPEHLFLVGKSVGYRSTTTPSSFRANLVPTYGHQPSDNILGVKNIFDYRPQLGIGRISAQTPTDVRNYLNKIQQYEILEDCTREDRLWRKHALYMATGDNTTQYIEYEGFLEYYKSVFDNQSYYGGKVLDIQTGLNYSSAFRTRPFIEDGMAIFTFMGHSTGEIWKTDILENPAGYALQKAPRFPLFVSGSCFVGNVHKSVNAKPSMAESYVLANNKGAIGFLATVQFGFPSTLDIYTRELYHQFTGNNGGVPINQGKPIGTLIKNTLENIYIASPAAPFYEGVKATSEEFTYQGDPALVIGHIQENPEYIIENSYQFTYVDVDNNYVKKTIPRDDVQVFNESGTLLSSGDNLVEADAGEDLTFRVRCTNLGKAVSQNYNVKISRRIQGNSVATTLSNGSFPSAKYETTHVIEVPYPAGTNDNATYEYIVEVDANNAMTEDCEDNNEVILRVRYAPDACNAVAAQYENLSITNTQSTYCVNDPAIQLQGNISGGAFKITQVGGPTYNVNVFQPSQLGGGQFIITYTVTDSGTGCVFSTEEIVTVIEPIASIQSVSLSEVCVGDEVNITAAASEGEYIWNFGTQGDYTFTGSVAAPILSWNTPGEKFVTLKVAEAGCESATITQKITVYPQVPQNFLINCDAGADFINFTWVAEGASKFQIFKNGGFEAEVEGSVSTYTFSGLEAEEDVEIRVVAVPYATCEEVSSTVTCKAACGGDTPVITELANQSSYCASSPVTIDPIIDGTFIVTAQNGGNITNYNNILPTAGLGIGSYTIVFEYSEGACTYASVEYNITITNPQVSISGNELLCPEETVTLSVPEAYFGYEWEDISGATAAQLEVSEPGIYKVIVTDFNGCTAFDTFEVGMAEDPNEQIFTSGNNTTLCDDTNIELFIIDAYESYFWTGFGSITNKLTVTEPGDYFVEYQDANGCVWRSEVTITGAQSPTFETSLDCQASTYTIEAIGEYDAYQWEVEGETDAQLVVSEAGTYGVTVTDGAGCTSTAATTVQGDAFETLEVSLNTGEDNAICDGEEIILTVDNANATNIQWSSDETSSSITVNQIGTYTVTAMIGGCEKTFTQEVVEDPIGTPTAAFTVESNNLCIGESLAFSNASTNAAAYNWTFTNDATGTVQNSADENPTLNFEEVGNYTVKLVVEATCGSKQATETLTTAFKVNGDPEFEIMADEMSVCAGASLTLAAEGNGIEYTWDGGAVAGTVSDAVKIQPLETTTYMVTAVNETGCVKTTSITIGVDICEFDIPNVITPNNDGFNDYWHIPQIDAGNEAIYVEIYNRWGQKVFSIINYDNSSRKWDGRNDGGDELPHGTYYYVIDLNDGTAPLTGHVTVLR